MLRGNEPKQTAAEDINKKPCTCQQFLHKKVWLVNYHVLFQ